MKYEKHFRIKQEKNSVVRIDKSLNKYKDVVLFPEKVEKAKKAFKKLGLPDLKK
ncbi:MAG: hypothetical protein WDM90_06925 [Ferruginibacter sp.]